MLFKPDDAEACTLQDFMAFLRIRPNLLKYDIADVGQKFSRTFQNLRFVKLHIELHNPDLRVDKFIEATHLNCNARALRFQLVVPTRQVHSTLVLLVSRNVEKSCLASATA